MENIEPVNGKVVGYPTPTVGGPGAPSCYRVSLLSGSLEVTARLKSADDLELLVKVLEANKPLFAKVDRMAAEVLTFTEELLAGAPAWPRSEWKYSLKLPQELLAPLRFQFDTVPRPGT